MVKHQIRCLLTLAFAAPAFGASIFVSPSGNDSTGDGSIGFPYLTIGKGISEMSTGDTLNIRAGTYGEYINNTVPSGTDWNSPTIVQAYNGEAVTLNPVTPSETDIIRVTDASKHHILFHGLVLDGINMVNGGNGVKITYTTPGQPATHIRFTDCVVKNIYDGMGFLLTASVDYSPTYCEFIRCVVTRAGYSGNGSPNKHGFYVSTSENLIDSCTVYSNLNLGVHLFSGRPSGNVIRNSLFPTSPGKDAIGIYGGTNNSVYNNVFYEYNVGVLVNPSDFTTNTFIANNTFNSNGVAILLQGSDSGSATIENNVIADQSNVNYGAIHLHTDVSSSSPIVVRNNVIAGSGQKGQIYDEAGGATVSGNLTNQVSILFYNVFGAEFGLTMGSPAVDFGLT